ncbi:hypothetical protein B0O99DRAFT_638639 [Bisporella sp. PMI_857]|nr:hypothetical protein B0O99DRAFT_638639 [Bisporella sp. PMI_857]
MESLRSTLQPITHNLPVPIRDLGVSILGKTCYKSLLLDIDLEATECLKLAVSKGLGIGIIGASAIVKVPQIIKLYGSKSASGISFLSYLLESASYLISLAYNVRQEFPFSTYGETGFMLVQNVVISALVLHYTNKSTTAAAFVAQLAASAFLLFNKDLVPSETLQYLQAGAGALSVASKLPQIWTIYQQGGTGQLSAFAVFNYLAGSLSRIFTTLQEVDDKLILYGFIAGFALNAVLAAQMIYYWNAPVAKSKGKQKEKLPIAPFATPDGKSSAASKGKQPGSLRRRG